MTKAEQEWSLIEALEYCKKKRPSNKSCAGCPYAGVGCAIDAAIALLKAQEPRVEMQGRWERVGSDGIVCCSVCGVPMGKTRVCFPDGESGYYYIATKYCPHCGVLNEKGDCDG